uniref:SCAN box domain-containing protein n=1 Tax=Erpetoichthys calabaricus TaxID=27687 RepID=A0A8C4RG33_ERPCA
LAIPVDDPLKYDSLKATIPSAKELLTLLNELCTKWLQPNKDSVEQIIEFIVLEQLLEVFDFKLCTWVEEHHPKTSKEAAKLTEIFMSERWFDRSSGHLSSGQSEPWRYKVWAMNCQWVSVTICLTQCY